MGYIYLQPKKQMIKQKLTQLSLLVFFSAATTCFAQQNTEAAGGNATGAGGSVSYSVGQTDYHYLSGSNGNVNEGVQQPYEIFTFSVDDNASQWGLSVYPNPTSDVLYLKIEKENFANLQYQLIDMNGKVILNNNIQNSVTEINMKSISSSTYFLTVINNKQTITTFKIIKK